MHSPLFTPQVGAQFDPIIGEHRANRAEERFIDRGGRWWMQQARLYAEQLSAANSSSSSFSSSSSNSPSQPGTPNPEQSQSTPSAERATNLPLPIGWGEGCKGEGSTSHRLPVQTVERLHRLLEGDGRVEAMVLSFIKHRYGAENLFYLPPHVAREILKRPADFIQAAKQHCEPELFTTFHVAISEGGRA